jgi:hypothetical protein
MTSSETLEASPEIGSVRSGRGLCVVKKAGFSTKQPLESNLGLGHVFLNITSQVIRKNKPVASVKSLKVRNNVPSRRGLQCGVSGRNQLFSFRTLSSTRHLRLSKVSISSTALSSLIRSIRGKRNENPLLCCADSCTRSKVTSRMTFCSTSRTLWSDSKYHPRFCQISNASVVSSASIQLPPLPRRNLPDDRKFPDEVFAPGFRPHPLRVVPAG